MECSWKMLLLLALAFLAVQYVAIRKMTLRDPLNGPCQGAHRCHSRHHGGTLDIYICQSHSTLKFEKENLSFEMFRKGKGRLKQISRIKTLGRLVKSNVANCE